MLLRRRRLVHLRRQSLHAPHECCNMERSTRGVRRNVRRGCEQRQEWSMPAKASWFRRMFSNRARSKSFSGSGSGTGAARTARTTSWGALLLQNEADGTPQTGPRVSFTHVARFAMKPTYTRPGRPPTHVTLLPTHLAPPSDLEPRPARRRWPPR